MPAESAAALLKDRAFLRLWIAVILSFLGHFVNIIACAWVMTELTHSATMVALVQTAASLPMAFLSLFAGGVADLFDRRHVMLAAVTANLAISTILLGLSASGVHTPVSLLVLVSFMSLGTAVLVPAWQSSLGDLVDRDNLPEAVSLHTIGANLIKTIGPFAGGIVLARFGASATFGLSAIGYLPSIIALSRWRPPPRGEAQAGSLLDAVGEGLRHFRSTPRLFPVVEWIFLFGLAGSAVLSLLPLVARDQLQADADVYGLLFGGYGLGAILCGMSMGRLRRKFGMQPVVLGAIAVNAAALLLLAHAGHVALAFLASTACGGGWLIVLTLLNSTLQLATPRRLVGRMVSIFITFTYFGIALGGWFWGILSEALGTGGALTVASCVMACILPYAKWRPLPRTSMPGSPMPPAADLS